ncbi:MAG TPA: AbrB/MazE/SpoVT family DNA-binding domain-containing protein [Bacteroidota bacterium]|nr:AbrB/MazE/SpoVT family DNA-binding domain-containing protein [Bacteroidota bacterium]
METRVKKWGNSLAIRVPQAIASQINITEGSKIKLILKKNMIEIIPTESREYHLNNLLQAVTKENQHKEISTDSPIGKEIW